jgi:hypothetical protein
VHLFAGGTGVLLGTLQADDQGDIRVEDAFTIPTSARGPLTLTAIGTLSARPATATLDVVPFGPSLWLSAYAGHPGATVAFTGTGFAKEDILQVLIGDSATPAAEFHAHNGAFAGAGAIHLAWTTPEGMLPLTVHGLLSDTRVTLKYLVVAYKPGAGFEIKRHDGYTRLRLGAGGFAPHEMVRYYIGTDRGGTPWKVLRTDANGGLPLIPILYEKGTPREHLVYTLVAPLSGTQAVAEYVPPKGHTAKL